MFEMDRLRPSFILSAEALVDVVRGDLCDVVGEVAGQVELAQLRHGALLLVVVAQLLVHRLYMERWMFAVNIFFTRNEIHKPR